jgi:hypothetical protein
MSQMSLILNSNSKFQHSKILRNSKIPVKTGTRSPDPPDPIDHKAAKNLQPGGITPCPCAHPLIRGCAAAVAARPKAARPSSSGLSHLWRGLSEDHRFASSPGRQQQPHPMLVGTPTSFERGNCREGTCSIDVGIEAVIGDAEIGHNVGKDRKK